MLYLLALILEKKRVLWQNCHAPKPGTEGEPCLTSINLTYSSIPTTFNHPQQLLYTHVG